MPRLVNTLFAALTLCYPFAVYFGLGRLQPWQLSGALLAVALLRLFSIKPQQRALGLVAVLALVLLTAYTWLRESADALRYYPVLMNAAMLAVFVLSLRFPPSIIERFARLREPALPEHAVHYTRRVTQIWCGFFIVNGAIALWTALVADWKTWTLYNGFIAYLLMGALLLGEYCVRGFFRSAAR
jgi:uncharacterized membrane protein